MKKVPLSVVIITKNEEEMIRGCLDSVSWAKDIIVVDCGSSDKTLQYARGRARIFHKKWTGFASQKNFGISKALEEWVLILDADERVSLELKHELSRALLDTRYVAWSIVFRNFFLGREMKHGGWSGERHTRLFSRRAARYADQEIHEILEINGETGVLDAPILHFSHRDIASNLAKTRQYAIIQSALEAKRGFPTVTRWTLFRNVVEHFWLRYIKLQGYKDGMEGFIEAMYQAFSQIFVIQSMIWEHQRGNTQRIYRDLDRKISDRR